jgi:hypothetical protein
VHIGEGQTGTGAGTTEAGEPATVALPPAAPVRAARRPRFRLPADLPRRCRAAAAALAPAGVYLAVRAVGIVALGLMAAANGTDLLDELRSWDGQWLLAIAEHGYAGVPGTLVDAFQRRTPDTSYAFFPGYPALILTASLLTGGNLLAAALLTSGIAGVAAAYGLVRLAQLVPGGSRRGGLLLVALFAAAPMGVVLSMVYTEALFCALGVWALVGVLQRQWVLAGCCAGAAGLVRPTGSSLALAVALAALVAIVQRRDGLRPWLAALLAVGGSLAYLAYVGWHTGSATGWFAIQRDGWGTEFDAGASLARFLGRTLTGAHEIYDLAVVLALVGSAVLLVLCLRMRLPWPVLVYTLAVLVTVWASDGQIHSRLRLLVPAFPLLLPAALALAGRRTGTAVAVVTGAALASAWFGGYTLTIWRYAI